MCFIISICYLKAQNINDKERLKVEKDILKTVILNSELINNTEFDIVCDNPINPLFYIKYDKDNYLFEKNSFLDETELVNIPEHVLLELSQDSKQQKDKNEKWSNDLLEYLNSNQAIIKIEKFLSKKERIRFFKRKNKRKIVYAISKPILDKKIEHCIVDVFVSCSSSLFHYSIFLKKIYGIWVVVSYFDSWI